MFVQGKVFEIEGFTKHCFELLKRGNLIFYVKGGARSLSALRADVAKRKALRTMRRSIDLIKAAIAAEFPDFDAVMAFRVFDLSPDSGSSTAEGKADSIARLAKVFALNPGKLKAEFDRLWPIAFAQHKNAGCNNRQAWQFAFRRAVSKTSQAWDLDNLEVVPCQQDHISFELDFVHAQQCPTKSKRSIINVHINPVKYELNVRFFQRSCHGQLPHRAWSKLFPKLRGTICIDTAVLQTRFAGPCWV